jgi:hypothetical protein
MSFSGIPATLLNHRPSRVLIGAAFCLCVFVRGRADETREPEPPIANVDREHWSFQPLAHPKPPVVRNAAWCRTPIDRFILAELEKGELRPLPPAAKLTLLRRVTFDLTGLPPTLEEIMAFEADNGPRAYERVIDRLLASRAYGERWAQHWLDLARFAETDGFEHDLLRPNAWRYRDWVIAALNDDMPYDEFVRLQLAGDELRPGDASAIIATGFLLCGPDMPDINSQEERRHNFLNGITGTVGSIFMGLQFDCAACHDHKYDPISQFDFYRLRAFFEPAELFRETPIPSLADQAAMERFEQERAERWRQLEAEIAQLRTDNTDANAARIKVLEKDLSQVKTAKTPIVPMARVVSEKRSEAPASHLWIRGDFRRRGPEVEPAYLRVVNPGAESVPQAGAEAATTGRRTALAAWLTRAEHPLTTRVIVNRIWQHHFGKGLCATPSDFGLMGDSPTHPELLDWLATELPRRGWSLKDLHRLIVTSSVYRLASCPEVAEMNAEWRALIEADPDNRLLGRMRRARLDGEAIRDAMLAACERLCDNAGGQGVRPPLPAEVVSTLLKDQWPVTQNAADQQRRSIYLFVRRNLRYPLFEAFDRPDTNQSCPRRNETTIAPQALELLNSEFSLRCATDLASLLERECGNDREARIERCYLRTLGRLPTPDERERAGAFDRESPLIDLCLAMFNLNEFVYVD